MYKRRKILTKEEIENIAQYQWASINDIMNIGAIGKNKAREVLKIISNEYNKERTIIQSGLVPMNMVLNYFNINKGEESYGNIQ
jgi:hypothetical protein